MSQQSESNKQKQLNQLSKKELVEVIWAQQKIIEELKIEIEKLKISRNLDSKISSKLPSSDLLAKPEKKDQSSGKKPNKSPGINNKSIGIALTKIINEAFKQHRLWRDYKRPVLKIDN